MKRKIESLPNYIKCDDSDFLETLLSANVFISDVSSTWYEFSITGNPMIYCNSEIKLNEFGKKLKDISYSVDNAKEMNENLDNLLYNNIDPKKDYRTSLSKSMFAIPDNHGMACECLYDFILKDSTEDL